MDKTEIVKDLESVNLPYPQSNAGYNPIDIIQGLYHIWGSPVTHFLKFEDHSLYPYISYAVF